VNGAVGGGGRQHQQRRDCWLEANGHLNTLVSAGRAGPGLAAVRHRACGRGRPTPLCPGWSPIE